MCDFCLNQLRWFRFFISAWQFVKKKLLMQKVFNFLVRITCMCTVGISLTASELTEKKITFTPNVGKINKECYKGS